MVNENMNKDMLKRIYKTVLSYYEINKDVLSHMEIKDIIEQKVALEREMRKFWRR